MRPLLMAAWHGHYEAMKLLLDLGACVKSVNKVRKPFIIFFNKEHHNMSVIVCSDLIQWRKTNTWEDNVISELNEKVKWQNIL